MLCKNAKTNAPNVKKQVDCVILKHAITIKVNVLKGYTKYKIFLFALT